MLGSYQTSSSILFIRIRSPKNVRLTKEQLQTASEIIESMKCFITKEFCRKPRSLNDVDRWKATELRQFLLYTGPRGFEISFAKRFV